MKRILLLTIAFILIITVKVTGQGINCSTATSFCTGSTNTYPASINVKSDTATIYPNYGCLCTRPNPAWYYTQIAVSGNIVIHISQVPSYDVDFICWGPFASITDACTNGLTGNCTGCYTGCPNNVDQPTFYPSGNITDCSYSPNATEDCYINNAVAGQYYMLLITNYSDEPCNITFTQSNVGVAGAGSTDCSNTFPIPILSSSPYCIGDTLKLIGDTISGALYNSTYNWTGPNGWTSTQVDPVRPNATPAMSGTYICKVVNDTVLIAIDTIPVVISPSPIVTATSASICFGDTATLTVSGAASYLWGNLMTNDTIKVSPFMTSTYPVCGIDTNNCTAYANATVTVNTMANKPTISQNGNVLTSSSAVGNQWLLNGLPIPGDTNQTITVTNPVTDTSCYSVTATNNYNCGSTSDTICFYPLGITEVANNNGITIYPNPFKDELIIETKLNTEYRLEILNLFGQTVSNNIINKKTTVNTTAFANGIYFLKISSDKETMVKKFIKQ